MLKIKLFTFFDYVDEYNQFFLLEKYANILVTTTENSRELQRD